MPQKSKMKQSQKQEQNVKIVINQADKKKQTKSKRKRASKAPEAYITPEQKMRMYQTYAPPQITYNTTIPNSDILNILRSNLSRNDGILPIMNDVRQQLNPAVRQEADQVRMVNREAERARNLYVRQPDPQPIPPVPQPIPPDPQPIPPDPINVPPPRKAENRQSIEISSSPGSIVVNQEPLNEILRNRQNNQAAGPIFRDYGGGAGGIFKESGQAIDSPVPVPRNVVRVSPVRMIQPPLEDIAPAVSPPPSLLGEPSPSPVSPLASSSALVPVSENTSTKTTNKIQDYFTKVVKTLTPNRRKSKPDGEKAGDAVPTRAVEMGIVPYIPGNIDVGDGTFAPPPSSTSSPSLSLSPSEIGPRGKSLRNELNLPFASEIPRNKDGTFKKNSKEYKALAKSASPETIRMYESSTKPMNPNFGKLNLT
jgi:hypothetical protein